MTEADFRATVTKYNKKNPAQRPGQALFNVLWDMDKDLAQRIQGSALNPFNRMTKATEEALFKYLHKTAFLNG